MEMRTEDMFHLFVLSESLSVNFGPATPRASEEHGWRTRNRLCVVRYVHVATPRASEQDRTKNKTRVRAKALNISVVCVCENLRRHPASYLYGYIFAGIQLNIIVSIRRYPASYLYAHIFAGIRLSNISRFNQPVSGLILVCTHIRRHPA